MIRKRGREYDLGAGSLPLGPACLLRIRDALPRGCRHLARSAAAARGLGSRGAARRSGFGGCPRAVGARARAFPLSPVSLHPLTNRLALCCRHASATPASTRGRRTVFRAALRGSRAALLPKLRERLVDAG